MPPTPPCGPDRHAARPPGSAGAAGAIGADSWLAAHAGPIVPVRPPGLHVIAYVADVDVVADIDVAVIDAAVPARIAGPDRRIDRARSPIPIIVVPQRPDRDAGPKTQERRDSRIGLVGRDRVISRDIDGRRDRSAGWRYSSPRLAALSTPEARPLLAARSPPCVRSSADPSSSGSRPLPPWREAPG